MPQGEPWTESKCLVGKTPNEKKCILHHQHLDLTAFQTAFSLVSLGVPSDGCRRKGDFTLYSANSTLFHLYEHLPETPAWGCGREGAEM